MVLVKESVVVDDPWIAVDDEGDLPEGPAIVSLARWREDRDRLEGRNAALGIRLASDQSPEEIAPDLDRFSVVALEFPVFTDGRAFTSARLLRERFGYGGEIRAVGEVLRDQILFMVRCGFDAFELEGPRADHDWRAALAEIDVFYQPAADRRASVLETRHS
jgi:uncharacterized protein (DUF934 family)